MDALKLELIFPDKDYVKYMPEVTNTSIFEDNGKSLAEDGLYSQSLFGTVGSVDRTKVFGYINLYDNLIHPRLYMYIVSLSAIYEKIMMSKAYVIFDKEKGDFVESDIIDGFTGYNYFMKHLPYIKFRETDSKIRKTKIKTLYRFIKKGSYINDKLLVLPAGLREINVDKSGNVKEVDINDLYKKVINTSKLLKVMKGIEGNDKLVFKVQTAIQDVYTHLLSLLGGKGKKIQGEWASRSVEFKTRSVAVSTEDIIENLDETDIDMVDVSKAGLALYLKAIDPIAKHLLNKHFTRYIFKHNNDVATLINSDTMLPEEVELSSKIRDRWMTSDGMDGILNTMLDNNVKNEYVMLGNFYLAVLVDKGTSITRYLDARDIPIEDVKYVRPITYGELFYIAVYEKIGKLPGFIVRYPITEQGSLVLTKVGVSTTTKTRDVVYREIGIVPRDFKMINYPNQDSNWINGLKVSFTRYSGLGLDFDGDDIGLVVSMSEEAIMDLNESMDSTVPYIGPDGKSMLSVSDAVMNNVFKFMTRGR